MREPWTHKVKHQRLWLRIHVNPWNKNDKIEDYLGSDGQFHSYYKDDPKIVKVKKRQVRDG